jgi:hypothetical protein
MTKEKFDWLYTRKLRLLMDKLIITCNYVKHFSLWYWNCMGSAMFSITAFVDLEYNIQLSTSKPLNMMWY